MKITRKQAFILTLCLFLTSLSPLLAEGAQEEQREEFAYETVGPQGEAPVGYDRIDLSSDDRDLIREKGYKAAILMHTSSDWTNAVIAGTKETFANLGVEVVAVTDAEMDPNKQRTDVETTLALQPDIIVTLVLDPVSGSVALKQAVDKGVKVVLISNLPNDFVHGRDYAGIVTDDLFQMGKATAEMIGRSLNGKGRVALMYHDAAYYVTNQRDRAVEAVLRRDYPGIEIVTKKGIVNPSDGDVIASAILTQYPDVDAIYAPWDTIAEGVVAGVRAADREDVGVFTMDLGANNAMDLIKGGNMRGMVADLPYVLGETLAKMGALSALGKETPAFVTVPAIKVDKENIASNWQLSLNRPLPDDLRKAMK